jgi:hypothetical protein
VNTFSGARQQQVASGCPQFLEKSAEKTPRAPRWREERGEPARKLFAAGVQA